MTRFIKASQLTLHTDHLPDALLILLPDFARVRTTEVWFISVDPLVGRDRLLVQVVIEYVLHRVAVAFGGQEYARMLIGHPQTFMYTWIYEI